MYILMQFENIFKPENLFALYFSWKTQTNQYESC